MINPQSRIHWYIGCSISLVGVLIKNHVGLNWINERRLPWLDLCGIFIATLGLAVIAVGAARTRKKFRSTSPATE